MPARRHPLPPALDLPFTVEQGLAAGLTRDRLRGRDLLISSRGLRVPRNSTATLVENCRAHLQVLQGAVVSHATAAKVHGLVLPGRLAAEAAIHLSRTPSEPAPRRRRVSGHRLKLDSSEVVSIAGVRVTSVARTWLDLAGMLSVDELVVAGDHIVSEYRRSFGPPRQPIVPLNELTSYLESKRWLPHIQRSRSALALVRVGVDSPPESWLRLLLHHAGLPPFVPNFPVLSANGRPAVWVDLACEQFRTCLEYDGGHHLTPDQQSSDHRRDLATAEAGWVQVKISRNDLRRGKDFVVAKVQRGLVLGGWRP